MPTNNKIPILLLTLAFLLLTVTMTTVAQEGGGAATPAAATPPAPITVKYNPVDNAALVYVPAGVIERGVILDGYQRKKYFKASLDGFWAYQTLVTVAQYRYFCTMTNRDMPEEPFWGWHDDHPIVNVTWDDANAYAKWAGGVLPTDAQWQLAGFGTTLPNPTCFPWGLKYESAKVVNNLETGTMPVGSRPEGASKFGLQDIVGNAWEWCANYKSEFGKYPSVAPLKNPPGPDVGYKHDTRGGSWLSGTDSHAAAGCIEGNFLVTDSIEYFDILTGFRCIYSGTPSDVAVQELPAPPAEKPIKLVRTDGCNLKVTARADHALTVQINSACNNWWAGNFADMPTDQPMVITIPKYTPMIPVHIRISVDDIIEGPRPVNMSNWRGLLPVYTYADMNKYESYECFTKDDTGRWVSDDICKQGDARYAGTGKTPVQSAIPDELAALFLSKDGNRWEPWRDVDKAEVTADGSSFVITQQFAFPRVALAMRVPYAYTYEVELLKRLSKANIPGLYVDKYTDNVVRKMVNPNEFTSRSYHVIRLESPAAAGEDVKSRPGIFTYAREVTTEQEGSWAIQGMLRWLLSDDKSAVQARQQNNWIFSPIIDVDTSAENIWRDGSAFSVFELDRPQSQSSFQIARYLAKKLDAGYRFDLVLNLHNAEASEASNLSISPYSWSNMRSPYTLAKLKVEAKKMKAEDAIKNSIFKEASMTGYINGSSEVRRFTDFDLLVNWANLLDCAIGLSLELNSRYPQHRQSFSELQDMGQIISSNSAAFLASPAYDEQKMIVSNFLALRPEAKKKYKDNHPFVYRPGYALFADGYYF